MTSDPATALLPAQALAGLRLGLSVSDSADLERLGLLPAHLQLAVREIARTVLTSGGTLAYGGHLQPDGFTAYLIAELQRYAQAGVFNGGGKRNGPALLVCLSLHEHRRVSLADLKLTRKCLGLHGTLRCLAVDGNVMGDCSAGRPASGEPSPADPALTAQALTALRHHMTAQCAGRVLIGGKRLGYTGRMPGLVEEALLALAAGQPLYLAAGLGGVTLDMAAWVDARCADHCPRHDDDPQPAAGTRDGLAQWAELIAEAGWQRLANGLTADENLRLATTHRPAEIAALVGLGLGRLGLRAG